MPRYKFRLLRQMNVDGSPRDVGELVNEAASWPNLRSYLSLEWVEKIPAADDDDQAVEYPPVTQVNTFAEALQPEGEPTPVTLASKRKTGTSRAIRCRNCRVRNHLPADFLETATWMCHHCFQPQTTVEAREHPSPTSLAEYAESIDARMVDASGDLTDKWQPGAGEAVAEHVIGGTGIDVEELTRQRQQLGEELMQEIGKT